MPGDISKGQSNRIRSKIYRIRTVRCKLRQNRFNALAQLFSTSRNAGRNFDTSALNALLALLTPFSSVLVAGFLSIESRPFSSHRGQITIAKW